MQSFTRRLIVRADERKAKFTNEDVYAFTRELGKLHPGNRHVRDKIRQQLQVLCDAGFLIHVSRNEWKLQ